VTGGPFGSGPAAAAPLLRRGRELRSDLLPRAFAVHRFFRFLILGAAAYRVWRFSYDRAASSGRSTTPCEAGASPAARHAARGARPRASASARAVRAAALMP
jgi:hypothetical protein